MDRSSMHKLFLAGEAEYVFATPGNARTARRALYAERARLARQSPEAPVAKAAARLKLSLDIKSRVIRVTIAPRVADQLAEQLTVNSRRAR
jgi:hypothetical protein